MNCKVCEEGSKSAEVPAVNNEHDIDGELFHLCAFHYRIYDEIMTQRALRLLHDALGDVLGPTIQGVN